MLSPKHSLTKHFVSPRASCKSTRLNELNNSTTEEQQERIRKLLNDVRRGGPLSPHAALLSQTELSRMKNSAVILTREEILQQKKILEEQNEKQQAAAKTKKQKMMEIEEDRKKAIPPSEIEIEKRMINESIQTRATVLLNEEKDDVKHMNKMILYAKVVTIRDNQLKEKQDIKAYSKKDEKRKDLLMEVERLKTIKYYEELEKFKMEEQKKAASATVKQIKEREGERLKQKEAKDKEGQDMVRRIIEIQEEDSKNSLIKKEQQKVLLDQILMENQKAIKGKHDKVRQEKEEEERIAKYLVERAQKDAEYQAELQRIKDEKEKEIQRLREMQEKQSDRMSDIDALRAKRAMEGADRQARDKDRREAEKRARINKELLESRQFQSLQKEMRLQEQAAAERDEFQRIVQSQKVERDMELRMEQEKKIRVQQHSEQLKKQIAIHEEIKKQERRDYLEEGKKMKDKLGNEKRLLENIKADKLDYLVDIGIPGKYTTELAKNRIII